MATPRRRFLRDSAAMVAAFVAAPGLVLRREGAPDVVLRNGTVFDGLGRAGVEADVAIAGGRVAAIARRIAEKGKVEIDCRGLAVTPGFVDIHSHGDGTLWDDPRAESLIRQGITTIVVGQDGSSRAPRGGAGEDGIGFTTFRQLWASLETLTPAVNVASMVGLGSVRLAVVGRDNRPATEPELARMLALVNDALAHGACGASSGLEYVPGAFAGANELEFLCRPLARRGLPYATHVRNEDDQLIEAVEESIAVARGARCRLQISHLKTQGPRNWGKLDAVLARIESANDSGLDVAFDRYPYVAYQTGLTNLFPVWSRDGGTEAFLARLDDSSTARRIREETLAKVDLIGGWSNVLITSVRDSSDREAEGRRLGEYAEARGVDPYRAATELLTRSRGNVGMVGFAMSEENIDRILSHPRGIVCSDGGSFALDGPARRGHPHPRSLGSFPRVLARYVRDRRALTLAEAIAKMTSRPAERVRLDRGRLVQSSAADVAVFDPATVADTATFAEPFSYPVGIKAVLVNGSIALLDGERGPARAGVPLMATAQ